MSEASHETNGYLAVELPAGVSYDDVWEWSEEHGETLSAALTRALETLLAS